MNTRLLAVPLLALLPSPLTAAPLTAIQELRFDAAQGKGDGSGGVTFTNLRARSAQSTLDDYIEVAYAVNPATGALAMQDATVLPGVGMLEPTKNFLAKDVPGTIYMYRTASQPQQYAMDTQHTLTTSNGPFYMDLTAGQCLSLHWAYPSAAGTLAITGPGGIRYGEYAYGASSSGNFVVFSSLPVLKTGTYRFDFVPRTGTTSSIRFRFLNENSRALVTGLTGTTITATLRSYSRDYAKTKVHLLANQTAEMTTASFSGGVMICNSRGTVDGVGNAGVQGSALVFTATREDDYYVFFESGDPKRATTTAVNFTLNIASSLAFANFAAAYGVDPLLQDPAQDSDHDGAANFLEYALGSNPADAAALPAIALTTQNGQLKMTYAIPAYTSGISVRPEFNSGLGAGWQTVVPQNAGPTGTGTRFEALSSGASPRRFLRIRVDQQ